MDIYWDTEDMSETDFFLVPKTSNYLYFSTIAGQRVSLLA